jgi:hypothetical protein
VTTLRSLPITVLVASGFFSAPLTPQVSAAPPGAAAKIPAGTTITLRATSTMNVASETGGAFMIPSKCDSDGNLYIRKYASDRPLLGPVVKIDADGKRVALFDPAAFSQLALNRADAFSPASDGGLYQIAQSRDATSASASGVPKPRIYVLRFSSDGSPSSPTRLDADFEVYTFAAFAGGNFLVSGVKRDASDKNDRGHNFTAVFSADGRELAQLSFTESPGRASEMHKPDDSQKSALTLDLAEAEAGSDGNLYVMRGSSPALVYVIASSGAITKKIKVTSPLPEAVPSAFHVSGNQLAISFAKEDAHAVVVADAQTGRKIASYGDATGVATSFACYSANEVFFTFLRLGEGNALEVIRAEPQ